jgi:hypothetical protein
VRVDPVRVRDRRGQRHEGADIAAAVAERRERDGDSLQRLRGVVERAIRPLPHHHDRAPGGDDAPVGQP